MSDEPHYDRRLAKAQSALGEVGGDLLVLFPSTNLGYLTGFFEEPMERHLFLLVAADGHAMVAPQMYVEQIDEETDLEGISGWDDGDDPVALTSDVIDDLGVSTTPHVLIDDTMFAHFTLELQDALPDATFGLASKVLSELRVQKDEYEIAQLRNAARIADEASVEIRTLGEAAIGMTERQLADEIASALDERGGEGFSFDPIIGAGPHGAQPHYRFGDHRIDLGEPVVLDFGARVGGYPGDQTRTVVFDGDPPDRFEDVHAIVCEALEAGIEAVAPGVEAQAVDRAARSVIETAGYGDNFIHRTGHGLGLDVHEPPYIVEGNEQQLEVGMVHSVEPGIYLEGEFGVRVEDIVVVTDDGCERLNDSPRTWRAL